MAILIAAVRVPIADGSKRTVKVVDPPGITGLVGSKDTLKSPAFVPLMLTLGEPVRVKLPVPVFSMVKTRSTDPLDISALPKSV